MAKSLQSAYISGGLTSTLAEIYATNCAVGALSKTCSNERVGLIIESGQLNTMNDAVAKFINSCTEVIGKQSSVLYYQNGNNYTRSRGYSNNRGYGRNYERGRGHGCGRGKNNSYCVNRNFQYIREQGNEFPPQKDTLGETKN